MRFRNNVNKKTEKFYSFANLNLLFADWADN